MPRKILLDGDVNGNRPNPIAALLLCLVPVMTFLYMKRRQQGRFNTTPSNNAVEPTNNAGGSADAQTDRGTGNAGDSRTRQSGSGDTAETRTKKAAETEKWEKKIKEEQDKLEQEKKKHKQTEAELKKANKTILEEKQKMVEARFKFDQEQHPEDPFLDDPTPDEVYDQVRTLNRNPPPPAKPAMRPAANGQSLPGYQQKEKKLNWRDLADETKKHP
jgi:hypothetical protein